MSFHDALGNEDTSESAPCRLVPPERVRIWAGNARSYGELTTERVQDLIDSIFAVGQQSPAIVRLVRDDPDHDYELITGCRRHWAITRIRQQFPIRLKVQVVDLNDQQAFVVTDTENRARQDVSDLERARQYGWALNAIYEGNLGFMASRMKVSKSWLSRMISVGRLPDEVVAAFPSVFDIKLKPAYEIAKALAFEERAFHIRERARTLASQQEQRRIAGREPIAVKEVYKLLLETGSRNGTALAQWKTPSGEVMLTLLDRKGPSLRLSVNVASGASTEELVASFREALLLQAAGENEAVSPGKRNVRSSPRGEGASQARGLRRRRVPGFTETPDIPGLL